MTDNNSPNNPDRAQLELEEILALRSQFPPMMPLAGQFEVVWYDGDDETAADIVKAIDRIEEITGRYPII